MSVPTRRNWCVTSPFKASSSYLFLLSPNLLFLLPCHLTSFSCLLASLPPLQVHTELIMEPGEFEAYTVGQPASLTFCLKVALLVDHFLAPFPLQELRSLIGFTAPLQLPINATFTEGGSPLVGFSCFYFFFYILLLHKFFPPISTSTSTSTFTSTSYLLPRC